MEESKILNYMNTTSSTDEIENYEVPETWPLLYWPNQLLSAMMVVGSLAFIQERLVDPEEQILLKMIMITLVISSFLYFGFLQTMKASIERGHLQSIAFKFFEPVGYILLVTALLAWAYLMSEASYIGSDLIVATSIFCTLIIFHGFMMFKLNRLRGKLPMKKPVTQ